MKIIQKEQKIVNDKYFFSVGHRQSWWPSSNVQLAAIEEREFDGRRRRIGQIDDVWI